MKQMKNEKPYYSKELASKLRRVIPRSKYGDFTVIIEDIFHRRAYEFGFSDEEIIEQAKNFAKNVDQIQFASSEDPAIGGTAMGVYCPAENLIKLNQDYYLNYERTAKSTEEFGEQMYETLTHEVYHAIGDHWYESRYLGLSYYDPISNTTKGSAFDEIFVETAADRASISRTSRDAEKGRRDTSGYSSITFATNLLAASLGLTEKELLKAGIQNRGKLFELIDTKFPTPAHTHEAQRIYIDSFEATLDTIYNLDYRKDENLSQKDQDYKRNLLKGSLAGLYRSAYEIASFQIAVDQRPLSREVSGEAEHRFAKMEKIIRDSLDSFSWRYGFSEQDKREIYEAIGRERTGVASKVVGMDLLLKQGYKIANPHEYQIQAENAKKGLLFTGNNIQRLQQVYGIEMPRGIGYEEALNITSDMVYDSHILKEDFDNGMQWDNEAAAEVLKKIFVNDMHSKGIKTRDDYKMFEEMETEELPTVDPGKTEELPIVDPDKTEELPIVDPDKTEEIPLVDPKEDKGFFGKVGKKIKEFITRFQNRNQGRLPPAQMNRSQEEGSEYFANLVISNIDVDMEHAAPEIENKELSEFDKRIKVDKDIRPTISTQKEQGGRDDDEKGNSR